MKPSKFTESDKGAPEDETPVSSGQYDEEHGLQSVIPADEPHELEIEAQPDFHSLSKAELVKAIEHYVEEKDYASIRAKIIPLRDAFRELIESEKEHLLQKYIEEGGEKQDFEYHPDELEQRFYDALKKVNKKRIDFLDAQEKQRTGNLAMKREILERLKNLIQNEDNLSRAFNVFHEMQATWREVGPVPQKDAHDLWMTYKLLTDQFYNFIRLNHELQDLDHKKNLEMKLSICEQAEALFVEPSINKALHRIYVLQNSWREIGSVPRERRAELGERFKSACDKIFDRKKEYVREIKRLQNENLQMKESVCSRAESITVTGDESHKSIQEKIKYLKELQAEWRTIGFAEKSDNEKIWQRFRKACNEFYRQKNEYYALLKREWQTNLQAKTELCIQAEALSNSTDWKIAGTELKKLHDAWKKIGHAGFHSSHKIWLRFKAASDAFYEKRKRHFDEVQESFEKNLLKKNQLIDEIMQCSLDTDQENGLNLIRGFQHRWSEIGMVPHEQMHTVYDKYKKAMDGLFEKLRVDKKAMRTLQYKERIKHLQSSPDGKSKLLDEKRVLQNKINHLNNEVITWENNLGFFAKSKNASPIIQDFEMKIKNAKDELDRLRAQLELVKKA